MQKENRNNRVHTGEQSGKTDFLIERLLPVGKENAITTQDLVKLSGCGSARELQQRIAYEREQGAIICSGSGRGYWRPKDRQEIQEFVHTMNARALNTLKAVKSAKRALKVPEGQQSMNGGNEDGKDIYNTLLMWNIVDDKKGLKVEKNRQGILSTEVLRFDGDNMQFIETDESIKEAAKGFRKAEEPTPFD